jgi:hypothetical protein
MGKQHQKICTKCKKSLPSNNFYLDRQKSDGFSSQCKPCRKAAVSIYRENNLDQCRASVKRYHEGNKDMVNAKRRIHKEITGRGQFNRINPDHFDFGASLRKPCGESSFARLVRQYKANAKRRGLEFSLSKEAVRRLTGSDCEYCGTPPRQVMQDKDANGPYIYNGIDRIDPGVGYVESNCTTACKICNKAKTNMTASEWREWLSRVSRYWLKKDEVPKSLVERKAA